MNGLSFIAFQTITSTLLVCKALIVERVKLTRFSIWLTGFSILFKLIHLLVSGSLTVQVESDLRNSLDVYGYNDVTKAAIDQVRKQ